MPASGIRFSAFRIRRCSDRRSHFSGGDENSFRANWVEKDDRLADFLTDAYATVGIAYHCAAGVYTMDKEMQELGTAAVHLLTMATSYTNAEQEEHRV